MKTLCWNCRGIGNPATVKELRDLAKDYAPSVMFIMETQISKYRVENLRYTLSFDNSFAVNSSGRSGGLGLFWNNDVLLSIQKYSNYHIDTIISEHGKEPRRMSFIYGEPNRSLRYRTWDIMKQMRSDTDLPWVCMGDFNEILRREEQLGPNEREEYLMEGFRDAVDVCQLRDIGYIGLDWTFEKKVAGGHFVRVRLDRALASMNWCARFPLATVQHLTTVKSDHCPILLSHVPEERNEGGGCQGKPFRYELMWETNERLSSLIEQIWKNGQHCNSVKDMKDKLFHLGEELKSWGGKTFGVVRKELRVQKKRLE